MKKILCSIFIIATLVIQIQCIFVNCRNKRILSFGKVKDCENGPNCEISCGKMLTDYLKKSIRGPLGKFKNFPKKPQNALDVIQPQEEDTTLFFRKKGDKIRKDPRRSGWGRKRVEIKKYYLFKKYYSYDMGLFKNVYFEVTDRDLFNKKCVVRKGNKRETLFHYLKRVIPKEKLGDVFFKRQYVGGVFMIWFWRFIVLCKEKKKMKMNGETIENLEAFKKQELSRLRLNENTSNILKNLKALHDIESKRLCDCHTFKSTKLDSLKLRWNIVQKCWKLNKHLFYHVEKKQSCFGSCIKNHKNKLKKIMMRRQRMQWRQNFCSFLEKEFKMSCNEVYRSLQMRGKASIAGKRKGVVDSFRIRMKADRASIRENGKCIGKLRKLERDLRIFVNKLGDLKNKRRRRK